uniref:Uncharacterized protein n=1 Tax=Vitis vinifera TaxID=29760 RepID=F6HX34_VITVI
MTFQKIHHLYTVYILFLIEVGLW